MIVEDVVLQPGLLELGPVDQPFHLPKPPTVGRTMHALSIGDLAAFSNAGRAVDRPNTSDSKLRQESQVTDHNKEVSQRVRFDADRSGAAAVIAGCAHYQIVEHRAVGLRFRSMPPHTHSSVSMQSTKLNFDFDALGSGLEQAYGSGISRNVAARLLRRRCLRARSLLVPNVGGHITASCLLVVLLRCPSPYRKASQVFMLTSKHTV